jgi:hypothetical protein
MNRMSTKEALEAVLLDIETRSVEELKAELEKHRNGDIATALRELQASLSEPSVNKV